MTYFISLKSSEINNNKKNQYFFLASDLHPCTTKFGIFSSATIKFQISPPRVATAWVKLEKKVLAYFTPFTNSENHKNKNLSWVFNHKKKQKKGFSPFHQIFSSCSRKFWNFIPAIFFKFNHFKISEIHKNLYKMWSNCF